MCTCSIEGFNVTHQLTTSPILLPTEIGHIPANRFPSSIRFKLLPRDGRPVGGQVPRGIYVLLTELYSYFTRCDLGIRLIIVV